MFSEGSTQTLALMSTSLEFPGIALMSVSVRHLDAALSRTHECTRHNVPLRQAEPWT